MFLADGKSVGVSIVETLPGVVSRIKNKEKDGYSAAQIEFQKTAKKKILKEYRSRFGAPETGLKEGDKVESSIFQIGDNVSVSGLSKGRGFQGVVKRHKFRGGSRTHGQKHSEREPGSIGSVWPQRVVKGKRMAGRMGNERVTAKGVKVLQIDAENNLMALKGAVPGRRGTLLEIKS